MHAIAVFILQAVFLVLMQTHPEPQAKLGVSKLKVPLQLGLNAPGVVVAVIVALDDGVVRAVTAPQVVELARIGGRVRQDVANPCAVNGLQLEPVA